MEGARVGEREREKFIHNVRSEHRPRGRWGAEA